MIWILPATGIAGCSLLATPADDPVLIRLEELDRRLQAIERVMDNQSLVQLTQQADTLERRADDPQGLVETLEHHATSKAEPQRQL